MVRILYFFSKTDIGIIRHCPSSTKNIHATLGFFVLMTGLMAFVSGSYAISNMFVTENIETGKPEMAAHGWLYSMILGFVYALFIMSIDREIVSSNTRWAATLRIPLAIIISIVVSVPVELQIFEGRINKHLRSKQRQENDSLSNKLENDNRIPSLEEEIKNTEKLRQGAIEKRDYWADAIEAEVVGRIRDDRTGKAGKGPAYEEATMNKQLQEESIVKYDSALLAKRKELAGAKEAKDRSFNNNRILQSYDLLSKYIALKEVKKDDKTGSASAIGFGLMILFCLFELIPSIMKILYPPSEYDAILDKRRRLNINATKMIYQQVWTEYGAMSVDEIVKYNPVAVEKIYEAQAR